MQALKQEEICIVPWKGGMFAIALEFRSLSVYTSFFGKYLWQEDFSHLK